LFLGIITNELRKPLEGPFPILVRSQVLQISNKGGNRDVLFHYDRQDYLVAADRDSNLLRHIVGAFGIVAPEQYEKIASTDRSDDFSIQNLTRQYRVLGCEDLCDARLGQCRACPIYDVEVLGGITDKDVV